MKSVRYRSPFGRCTTTRSKFCDPQAQSIGARLSICVHTVINYSMRHRRTNVQTTPASDWLDAMSVRLQKQWPTIDPQRLDDLALDLWRDEKLRSMGPERAAEEWLRPVSGQ